MESPAFLGPLGNKKAARAQRHGSFLPDSSLPLTCSLTDPDMSSCPQTTGLGTWGQKEGLSSNYNRQNQPTCSKCTWLVQITSLSRLIRLNF